MDIRPATRDEHPALCKLDAYAAEKRERQDEIRSWIEQGTRSQCYDKECPRIEITVTETE